MNNLDCYMNRFAALCIVEDPKRENLFRILKNALKQEQGVCDGYDCGTSSA
jgi:hypothetical protein